MQKQKNNPIKLGLLGVAGVGKDTFVQIIKEHFVDLHIQIIRLAEPIYAAQHAIYQLCNKNKDYYLQDGFLLNFLGQYMRKINPYVIQNSFTKALYENKENLDLIICSDVRPIDVPFVKSAGFQIVNIIADQDISIERRRLRGDILLANETPHLENIAFSDLYDYQISNNGSLLQFKQKIFQTLSL